MEHFADRLTDAIQRAGNAVCVGLDPRWQSLPDTFRSGTDSSYAAMADAYRSFCNGVTDVVAMLVPIVKVQAAFFEELGPSGMAAMGEVIAHAQALGLMVIVDGKRNDIGSTAEAYARGYLGREQSAWHADALTINPYLGSDTYVPFIQIASERGAGVFVLVKTSNPGGRFVQDVESGGLALYRQIGNIVEELAQTFPGDCGYGFFGAVVGATYPEQLLELRQLMPHTWFLVPGFGSQGGTAADVAGAFDSRGLGAIVNNSRGIIFAHERPEFADRFGAARWQDAVEAATRQMIDELRNAMPRR